MADARIGRIFVDFLTNSTQFASGLRRNRDALTRQRQAIRGLRRDVRTFNREAAVFGRRLGLLAASRWRASCSAPSRNLVRLWRRCEVLPANQLQMNLHGLRGSHYGLGTNNTDLQRRKLPRGSYELARAGVEVLNKSLEQLYLAH